MAVSSRADDVHSDEEALEFLLEGVESEHLLAARRGHRSKALVGLAAALAVFTVAWWGRQGHTPRDAHSSDFQLKFDFSKYWWGRSAGAPEFTATAQSPPVELFEASEAVHPRLAIERARSRERLKLEENLEQHLRSIVLVKSHYTSRTEGQEGPEGPGGPEECLSQAKALFEEAVATSGLVNELSDMELDAFKERFASAMEVHCKDSKKAWLEAAGKELEDQKPLMTQALAASINRAGLGYQAKMQDWLLHESVASFKHRLGMQATPKGQKSILKRKRRQAQRDLPEGFRAEDRWPVCAEPILRIHNQGECGSCWVFGALASVDARMCIASNGSWVAPKQVLSRLHAMSCAIGYHQPGGDGCQGGLPHWAMEMMAREGIVSGSCLPYYIGGEGVEHFDHQDIAPPCVTHCQGGYSLPMSQDRFSSQGVQNYDWITEVHGDSEKILALKTAIYEEGPVTFAFSANGAFMGYNGGVFSVCTGKDRANHAVYAFGWGLLPDAAGGEPVEFVEASNSWGSHWGADGHFRIHPRCITDVIIPGTIEASVVNHSIGAVDPDVPRDPENEYWPWEKPDECPYEDGCVTDMEGSADYKDSEMCLSSRLNGKKIRVAQFETEWGYDVLKVNGQSFSGKEGHGLNLAALNGLKVDDNGIKFTSDGSWHGPGFKLCAE